MTEFVLISGKHNCGRKMDFRIIDVRQDDNDKNSLVIAWMIYGICDKCKVVVVSAIFKQIEKPIQGIDFMINYERVAKEAKKRVKKIG
jgi:hypothetical protein